MNHLDQQIGYITVALGDPLVIGVGVNPTIIRDHHYEIFDSNNQQLYTIRGESYRRNMVDNPNPIKKFYINSFDENGFEIRYAGGIPPPNLGRLDVATDPVGCCSLPTASVSVAHQLIFPSDSTWEAKLLLLMGSFMIETAFCDREVP